MNGALAGLVILVIGDSHMAGRDYLVRRFTICSKARARAYRPTECAAPAPTRGCSGRRSLAAPLSGMIATRRSSPRTSRNIPGRSTICCKSTTQSGDRRSGRRDGGIRLAANAASLDIRAGSHAHDTDQGRERRLCLGRADRAARIPATTRPMRGSKTVGLSVAVGVSLPLCRFHPVRSARAVADHRRPAPDPLRLSHVGRRHHRRGRAVEGAERLALGVTGRGK